MMKRILAWVCIVLCGFVFLGCTQPTTFLEFDEDKPWGSLFNAYEKATYTVKIVEREQVGKETIDGQELGLGTLIYELSRIERNGTDYLLLSSDFTVTYHDNAKNGVSSTLTDTIKSEVIFKRDGLGVYSSEKTYTEAARRVSTEKDAKYRNTNSYYVMADYNLAKATVKKGQLVNENSGIIEDNDNYINEKDFTILNNLGQYFDNEQMFYALRSLKSLELGASGLLPISNIYEISSTINAKGKYKTTGFAFSVESDERQVSLDSSFASSYIEADENGDYTVSCMQVKIAKNDTEPGPAFVLNITDPSVEFKLGASVTKKLITSIKTVQYNLNTRAESSNIIYTLSDYTTTK